EGSNLPKPLSDTFGDRFLNGDVRDVKGHKVLGLSGGASKLGGTGLFDGTMADDELRENHQAENWAKPLMTEESLDILISHVPPTNGKGVKRENAVQHFKDFLFKRRESGLKSPKAIMSGHLHKATSVEYNEEIDALWIQPGTAGYNHNNGDHGSFIILNTNDNTQEVESVDEFRIYTKDNNTQEVEHYGTHSIDLSQEDLEDRVSFESVQKVLIEGHNQDYKDFRTIDINHKLLREGIKLDYATVEGAEKKEEALLNNLSLLQVYVDRVKKTIKDVVETERRELSKEKGEQELKNHELDSLRKNVYMKLSDVAAKLFHTTYEELNQMDPEIDEDIHRDGMIFRAYGVREHDINSLLKIEEAAKVEDFSHSFGAQFIEKAMQSTANDWQTKILNGLNAKDFQEMAELHLSQKVERTGYMRNKKEALDFWASSHKNGLITSHDALETAMYQEKKGYESNERTEDELYDLLGAKDLQKDPILDYQTAQKGAITRSIQEKLNQGYPIFKDEKGDYLMGKGQKIRPDEAKISDDYTLSDIANNLNYTPRPLRKALDEGNVILFKDGNDEQTYVGLTNREGGLEAHMPLEKSEGIDPSGYQIHQINGRGQGQQGQERQQPSEQEFQDFIRQLQAQQGNRQYQGQRDDVNLGEEYQPQNVMGGSSGPSSSFANTSMTN
nr:hypothetical protein [Candidatus Woesearchaeota archaeon]